jgi:hypothetical protein
LTKIFKNKKKIIYKFNNDKITRYSW